MNKNEEDFKELFKQFDRAWDDFYYRSDQGSDDFCKFGWSCDRILDTIRDMYTSGKIKF